MRDHESQRAREGFRELGGVGEGVIFMDKLGWYEKDLDFS